MIHWKKVYEAKTFVFFAPIFLKTLNLHRVLMVHKAQKDLYTILVSSALYAKFHFVEAFV